MCHDRYFLDRVVDKLFVFTGNGRIDIVHGSYSDYKADIGESNNSPFYVPEQQSASTHRTEAESDSMDTIGVSSSTESSHTESPVKKGLNKAEEAEYASIMEELPKLEHLVKGLDVMIGQAGTDYGKMQILMVEREETQSQIDTLTERWMELEERL